MSPMVTSSLHNSIKWCCDLNPGLLNNYFTFMNWNCNSLAKENFYRLGFLEAQNSIYNYDLISLCETSLNNQVEMPDLAEYFNNEYSFIACNKPDNTRHGGVGLSSSNHRLLLDYSIKIIFSSKRGKIYHFLNRS